MGNCQAAEAATVVIQHPAGNKVERIYWSVSAHQVMSSNPGHYVALVITSPSTATATATAVRTENGTPVKQLKLLRPDDTLLMGQVYRLVSFEDVLKEFAAKKCVKLGKLLKERGGPTPIGSKTRPLNAINPTKHDQEIKRLQGGGSSSSTRGVGIARHNGGGGQWRPALQSIAEMGT